MFFFCRGGRRSTHVACARSARLSLARTFARVLRPRSASFDSRVGAPLSPLGAGADGRRANGGAKQRVFFVKFIRTYYFFVVAIKIVAINHSTIQQLLVIIKTNNVECKQTRHDSRRLILLFDQRFITCFFFSFYFQIFFHFNANIRACASFLDSLRNSKII